MNFLGTSPAISEISKDHQFRGDSQELLIQYLMGWFFVFCFFFFEMKKSFSGGWCWLSVYPAPLCGSPLHPQLPVRQSGERKAQEQELWGLPSPGVQWSSPPNAPDLVHLLFLISAARIVYLATLLLIFFFKCKVKVLVAYLCPTLQPHGL